MTTFPRGVWLAGALLFVSSIALAADFGRTKGSFSVSAGGAATYTIPIWTPPGPNGVQPAISLTYNSQAGNGIAGVGWQVSGLSSIDRCDRSKQQDGTPGGVELQSTDRFCLDGARLRLSTGTYGAANSVYFTEIADYSRVTAYGTFGTGPDHFIVEAKDGLKYEYGNSTTAQTVVGTSVMRWQLNRVSDRNGNNYAIYYTTANGSSVPYRIFWTPASLNASTYRYVAEFQYFSNRTDSDSWLGLVAGNPVSERDRLSGIQIKSNGVVIHKYHFDYGTSSVTSRSLLTAAKECADDAETNCLLPITFSYQPGVSGITAGTGTPAAGSGVSGRFDFNGDGKDDAVYSSGNVWQVAFGSTSGFTGPYSTGAAGAILVDHFLPNGRDAIVTTVGGVLWSYRWDDSSSTFIGYNTGITSAAPTTSMDYDGDGLADLIYLVSQGASITVRHNTSTGSANPSFDGTTSVAAALPSGDFYATVASYSGIGLQRADVNGDGRQDLNAVVEVPFYINGQLRGYTGYLAVLLGSSAGPTLPPQGTWVQSGSPGEPALYFNDDQCTDRVVGTVIYISQCNGAYASTVTAPAAPIQLLDWDGDGRTDLLVNNGGTFGVYRSTGTGFTALLTTSIPSSGTFYTVDQDGDGLEDLIKVNGASPVSYWTHTSSGAAPIPYASNIPDLLANATDGFGLSISPSYTSTAWSNYDKGATTNYPLWEAGSAIVVARADSSDGIGGTFGKTYFYLGARTNRERRQSVGFQRMDETDLRTGVISRTYNEQSFPVSGMIAQQEVMQPNGVTPISRVVFVNNATQLDSTTNNQRYFNFVQGSTATNFEVGGTWDGALMRTVATSNLFDNNTGTLYDQTVTTTEPASGANGLAAGGSWISRTYLPLANLLNDTGPNWCIGRPGQTQQINSHNLGFGGQVTRTTNTTWDPQNCRPTQAVAEPGNSTLQVITDIGYDGFGNVNSTTVTGVGMSPRTSTAVYSDATYASGQFPLSMTNSLSQTSFSTWNYDLGLPTSATDPNNITTSWQYDVYGRRIRENEPDGTYSTWDYLQCTSGCDPRMRSYVDQNLRRADGVSYSRTVQHFDQFDRPIFEYKLRADGKYNVTTRNFDARGNLVTEFLPYSTPGNSIGGTTTTYDLVNRPTAISRPISDSNSAPQTTTIGYEGLSTRVTDGQGKWSVKTTQANGWLIRTTDANFYIEQYDYDAFGNVTRITDQGVGGNTFQTSTYNIRGMLTSRADMDMGTWSLTPNALGETVSQTDAKNQTTTFVFDPLGRLTNRTEAEGTSTWTWGDSSAAKNIGRISGVSGPGYSESYVYDSAGRASTATITADTTYQIDYSYNSIGALDTLTYPTSTASYRLKLQYDYQNGQLYRIKDFNAPSSVFWTANAFNSRNQVTQEALGNGLLVNRSIDAVTGWLKSIQTGLGGGSGVQWLEYEWDLAGNLKKRRDRNQSSLTEEFFYDNLYRLDYSQLNGVTNLDLAYDALGNITSKSDVGTYTYDVSKRHQVTSTSNGWTFTYDNNGNMTSGRGASLTWTSFNYPASITNGSDSSSFSYTPARQYWKQVSNYTNGGSATTIYVDSFLEKVTTTAGTDFRHMIRAGGATVVVSRQTTGTNSVYYLTSDNLGSSSTITNSSGGIQVNSSFGAFGQRRGSNWTGSPSAGDWSNIASATRRGYTGHSMLDNLSLVHMNGRVEDPLLGRFLSADPIIQDPLNTQSFNRYSYVQNNPLSLSDPSGFIVKDHNKPARTDGDKPKVVVERSSGGSHQWDFATNYGNSAWVTCSGNCMPSTIAVSSGGKTERTALYVRQATFSTSVPASNGQGPASNASLQAGYGAGIVYQVFIGKYAQSNLYAEFYPSDGHTAYTDIGRPSKALENMLFNRYADFGARVSGAWNDGLRTARTTIIMWGVGEVAAMGITAGLTYRAIASGSARGLGELDGIFSQTTNAAGGDVWTATGSIVQSDFVVYVNSGLMKHGSVNILTGAHGALNGVMTLDRGFLLDDTIAFGSIPGVQIFSVTEMAPGEISALLEGEGTTIGAFCNSGACLGF